MNFKDAKKDSPLRLFLEEKSKWKQRQEEFDNKNRLGQWDIWKFSYHETTCNNSDNSVEYGSCMDLSELEDRDDYSYIYKVGVFALIDSNKCDFAEFHIGIQGHPKDEFEYLGVLNFEDGENTDVEKTIKRIAISMLNCW